MARTHNMLHRITAAFNRRPIWVRVVIGVVALYFVWDVVSPSKYPLNIYTESRTELVFDGERIVVEGTNHCRRNSGINEDGEFWPMLILDSRGPAYRCNPEWFGARLSDGTALLVGGYSVNTTWSLLTRPYPVVDLYENREQAVRVPPAVIWLDDPRRPSRGEYYFSAAALDDPASRLTSIESEILSVRNTNMWTDLFLGRSAVDTADVVPWSSGAWLPQRLTAYYAITVPKELWSQVPDLEPLLAQYDQTVLLTGREQLPDAMRRSLGSVGSLGHELLHPVLWTPPDRARFVWSGRDSRQRFKKSLRIRPYVITDENILEPAASAPTGMLVLTDQPRHESKQQLAIPVGGQTVRMRSDRFWNSRRIIYDPKTGDMMRFAFTVVSRNLRNY